MTAPDLCLFCPPDNRKPVRSRGACGGCYTKLVRTGEGHKLLPRAKRGPQPGMTGVNRERDKEIVERVKAGETIVDVAKSFEISKQRVFQVLQEQGEEGAVIARERAAKEADDARRARRGKGKKRLHRAHGRRNEKRSAFGREVFHVKPFFDEDGEICQTTWARVIADSIDYFGYRIVTLEVNYPTTILQQFEKHRALPRSVVYSTASMRARPVVSLVAAVEKDPFVPVDFRQNQRGMQPGEGLSADAAARARDIWREGADQAAMTARALAELGVHKEIANRPLTPYAWTRSIVTGTDWREFFRLRLDAHAQGEFRTLAERMRDAIEESKPMTLETGLWHMPYRDAVRDPWPGDEAHWLALKSIRDAFADDKSGSFTALLLCSARAARVSYLTHEGKRDLGADLELARGLIKNVHMTPFEHVCQAMGDDSYWGPLRAWRPFRAVVAPRPPVLTRTWRDVEDDECSAQGDEA